MRHPISKLTKRIRDLALTAYKDGYLRHEFSDVESAHGAFRSVLIEDDIAIKFARYDRYASHNRAEWATWHRMSESVQRITAKPLCISNCGRVLAVELVPMTLRQDYNNDNRPNLHMDLRHFNDNLKTLLEESGFSSDEVRELVSDNHAGNVGIRENGDLCWIDYACYG